MSAALAKKQAPSLSILDKAIAKFRDYWVPAKRAEIKYEQLKAKSDKAKAAVIAIMQKAGIESHDSPYGKISLQTKETTNYEAVLTDIAEVYKIKHGVDLFTLVDVETLKAKHTKECDAFIRAPQAWGGKAS